jgi:hypothetical protein
LALQRRPQVAVSGHVAYGWPPLGQFEKPVDDLQVIGRKNEIVFEKKRIGRFVFDKYKLVGFAIISSDSQICLGKNDFAVGYHPRETHAAFIDQFLIRLGGAAVRIPGAVLKQIDLIERIELRRERVENLS